MATLEQDNWLKTWFGIDIPPGQAPASDAPREAAAGAGTLDLPKDYTTCDLTQLDKDIANTRSFVEDALSLERAMRLGALKAKIDIEDAETAAAEIRKSGLKLAKRDQKDLETKWDTVESRAADLEQRFHMAQKAEEDLSVALIELNNLPDQVPEKDDDKGGFSPGKHAEHVFDLLNSVIGVIKEGVGVREVVQAVLGSDAVKDRVEKLADRIAGIEQDIDRTMIALNAAINVLTFAAAKRARDSEVQLARAVDDFRRELALYNKARDGFTALLAETAAKLRGSGSRTGPDATVIAQTYGSVLVAGNAYQAAKSALITATLSEQQYQVWMDQLAPPGTLLLALPDGGEPTAERMMSVAGDLIFYQNRGKNFAYRATQQKIESYAQPLKAVRQVHAFADEVAGIMAAWTTAMTGVLG